MLLVKKRKGEAAQTQQGLLPTAQAPPPNITSAALYRFLCAAAVARRSDAQLDSHTLKGQHCVRPYLVESTTSRPICEVKQPQAQLVLRSVMTWEP